jgi:hypothetical protein
MGTRPPEVLELNLSVQPITGGYSLPLGLSS